MKTLIMFFVLSVVILAQPSPTIKTKIQKPLVGVTYIVYADVKLTNTTSTLIEDLDPLVTNITSYIKTLTNVTVNGDTTFGEFTIPVSTGIQYVKVGVSATSVNKKPSLLKVSGWLSVNPRETKPTFIIIQEK
jgi:hypothetical protein